MFFTILNKILYSIADKLVGQFCILHSVEIIFLVGLLFMSRRITEKFQNRCTCLVTLFLVNINLKLAVMDPVGIFLRFLL